MYAGFIKRAIQAAIMLIALQCLCACVSDTVMHDQSQRDATEMVALLNNSGISAVAAKEKGGKDRYSIQVERGYYAQAVALLSAKGYPRGNEASFEQMVAERGLLPSSRDIEALRVDHALGLEIEELLMTQPAISSAKVVVRSKYAGEKPSCAAVIQTPNEPRLLEDQIRKIIIPLIPGISAESLHLTIERRVLEDGISGTEGMMYENGKVIPVPLSSFLFGWRVAASDITNLALTLVATLILVLVVGVVGGYWYGFYMQSRRLLGDGGDAAIKSARPVKPERKREEGAPLL